MYNSGAQLDTRMKLWIEKNIGTLKTMALLTTAYLVAQEQKIDFQKRSNFAQA